MADLWFYSHDDERLGPCSGRQLKDLADHGGILPTDTVWKEGVEKGVLASKVKNLFRLVPVPPAELPLAVAQTEAPSPPVAELQPVEVSPAPAPVAASNWQTPARKARATAGRGAVIVGQDGVNVKVRKKCTTCGHTDSSWATMPIRNGMMRVGFYCPKCRKHRDVEVHGSLQ